MKEFDHAKSIYEAIKIPDNLEEKVQEAIQKGEQESMEKQRKKAGETKHVGTQSSVRSMVWKAAAGVIAVFLAGSAVIVNTSQVAAATLSELPVIGPVMKVLTVREYQYTDEDVQMQVEVPGIVVQETQTEQADAQQSIENVQGTDTTVESYIEDVNALIESRIEEYTKQAMQHIAEYKEAFLATGGTEEEFQAKDIKVDVSYEIKSQSDTFVSFVITANENWSNAYGVQYFYNLNLADGCDITLEDLLGADYKAIADEQIAAQMEERMAADSSVTYWLNGPVMGGFTGITDDVHFYINESGNPVIVFEKYEVAPGAMGSPEFEIKPEK